MKKSTLKEKIVQACQGCDCSCGHKSGRGGGDAVYGLGVVGAAFYFMPNASSLAEWLWHLFQTLTWPAFLVYELLKFISVPR